MGAPITGLQTEIWNNNIRSIVLLALYPFILAGVVYAAFFAWSMFGQSDHVMSFADARFSAELMLWQYWPIIGTVVAIWFMISYFFQGRMIRALSHSHPLTRKEEPELYNLVENMCISTGTTMPRVEIIETHARNAFASGINEKTYCITVTRGLMQSLTKDELEGVLAHELTHILNRDVRLLMVCVIFTGMLGVAAQLLWSFTRHSLRFSGGSGNNKNKGGMMMILLALLVILWIGYLATLLTRFAISRKREYMADAGAVQITKNPDAMMRALLRISGAADIPQAPDDIRALCFENRRAFLGLFATHPPIASRIQTISDYSGAPIPDVKPKIAAGPDQSFGSMEPRENWTTRERFKDRRTQNPWQ